MFAFFVSDSILNIIDGIVRILKNIKITFAIIFLRVEDFIGTMKDIVTKNWRIKRLRRTICLDIVPIDVTSISRYLAIKSICSIYPLFTIVGFIESLETIENFWSSSMMKRKAAKGREMWRDETRAKLLSKRYSLKEEKTLDAYLPYLFWEPKEKLLMKFKFAYWFK